MARGARQRVVLPFEVQSHVAVADALRASCVAGWVWTHFPAGEHRDKRVGAKLQRMGMKKGWSDFLLISPTGQLHCLEMKRGASALKREQVEFARTCLEVGVPFKVARSVEQALAILWDWGVIRMRIAA